MGVVGLGRVAWSLAMPVWNKGQIVGQKLPAQPKEVWEYEPD